jgi:hypothetical protein
MNSQFAPPPSAARVTLGWIADSSISGTAPTTAVYVQQRALAGGQNLTSHKKGNQHQQQKQSADDRQKKDPRDTLAQDRVNGVGESLSQGRTTGGLQRSPIAKSAVVASAAVLSGGRRGDRTLVRWCLRYAWI